MYSMIRKSTLRSPKPAARRLGLLLSCCSIIQPSASLPRYQNAPPPCLLVCQNSTVAHPHPSLFWWSESGISHSPSLTITNLKSCAQPFPVAIIIGCQAAMTALLVLAAGAVMGAPAQLRSPSALARLVYNMSSIHTMDPAIPSAVRSIRPFFLVQAVSGPPALRPTRPPASRVLIIKAIRTLRALRGGLPSSHVVSQFLDGPVLTSSDAPSDHLRSLPSLARSGLRAR